MKKMTISTFLNKETYRWKYVWLWTTVQNMLSSSLFFSFPWRAMPLPFGYTITPAICLPTSPSMLQYLPPPRSFLQTRLICISRRHSCFFQALFFLHCTWSSRNCYLTWSPLYPCVVSHVTGRAGGFWNGCLFPDGISCLKHVSKQQATRDTIQHEGAQD